LGKHLTLTTSDRHKLGAYRADPQGKPKGGMVVIQEIFGVNHHIRAVCDRLANEGYVAVAPAMFDRFKPNFECGYTPDEIAAARALVGNIDYDKAMKDVDAALGDVKAAGPCGITGFCFGGTVSFLSACKLNGLKAAISYYGGGIAKNADEKPKCPVQMHFGEKDAGIPMSDVETIKQKQPQAEVYVYPDAAHGFHCDERASFNKDASAVAWKRSMEFLAKNLK
jgi:carboxymethylenebutenolidase